MEPIIIREDLTAPDGTLAPLRIVVYDNNSRFINSMHSLVCPHVDHKWYLIAEIGAELSTEQFFGGPMKVFEGVTWTLHTMDEDYQPLVDDLKSKAVGYLAERFPADGVRKNRFTDWEPVLISPMPVSLVNAWRDELEGMPDDEAEIVQTAFDEMNRGYNAAEAEKAETAAHNVYHEVRFADEIDAADIPGTPIPSREELAAWKAGQTAAEQDQIIYENRKQTLGTKRAGRFIARQRAIAKKKAAQIINLDDAEGKPLPSMHSSMVLLTEDGPTDQGALHRAIAIARDLVRLGHWDGRSEIRIADPYAIYNRVEHFVTVAYEPDYRALVVRKAEKPQGE